MINFAEYIVSENRQYRKQLNDTKMALVLMTSVSVWLLNENLKLKKALRRAESKV